MLTNNVNRRMSRPNNLRVAAVAALALAIPLAACGGDDDDADQTPAPTPAAAPSTTEPIGPASDPGPIDPPPAGDSIDPATGEDISAACDQYVQVSAALSGQIDPEAVAAVLDEFAAAPPLRLTDSAPVIAESLKDAFSGNEDAIGTAEFTHALGEASGYLFDICELDAKLDVAGSDYAFGGLPEEVAAGRVGVRFANISAGNEPHELILMRRPDGDTRSIDEIVALGPEGLFGEYQMVGVTWAEVPSATMSAFFELEAGEYLALCTLPVGDDESAMHLHEGMIQGFSVR